MWVRLARCPVFRHGTHRDDCCFVLWSDTPIRCGLMRTTHRLRKLTDPSVRTFVRRYVVERARATLHGQPGRRIAADVRLGGAGSYELAPGSRVRRGARVFVARGALLQLGPGSTIGARSNINVMSSLVIGAGSDMSWDVEILDTDFHVILDEHGVPRPMTKPIVIGDHVLIGARATLLKGVTIGDGAIVAACAVVTRDVQPNTIVAGNPAVPVGRTAGWS